MEELEKLERSVIEVLGTQPLHLRMIHRMVNERSDDNVLTREVEQALDSLVDREKVEREGQHFTATRSEEK